MNRFCMNVFIFLSDETAKYLNERRRKRSEELVIFSNIYNQARLQLGEAKDPVTEKLTKAPQNIARNQKRLNKDFIKLQTCPSKREKLKIEIPRIKYDKKSLSTERPPLQRAQNIDHFKFFDNPPNEKLLLYRLLQPSSHTPDKWSAWNKQLKASVDYWQKRFPHTETPRRQARARV